LDRTRRSRLAGAGAPKPLKLQSLVLRSDSASHSAVFLVGFMGAGKSSVGHALGQRLNWIFEDLDDRIEQRERRRVAEIFRDSGEPAFRHAETLALKQVIEEIQGGISRIIALGGGAFAQKENVALLEAADTLTVFLDAPVEELWNRCCKQAAESGAQRPLLQDIKQFQKLYKSRRAHYQKAALHVKTGNRTIAAIVAEIEQLLDLKRIVTRTEQGEVE
jgi:shikimate kinase